MKKKQSLIFIFIIIAFLIEACGNKDSYMPKPYGYFRIVLPKKEYQLFDSPKFPYSFEYPVYAKIIEDYGTGTKNYWINIVFPDYSGQVSITYLPTYNNIDTLYKYTEDSYMFVSKHIPMANDISPKVIHNDTNRVYGLQYDIVGIGAASPFQFFVTDSVNHFLRASLHFSVVPNNDSLASVIDFIKNDMIHIVNTLEWK